MFRELRVCFVDDSQLPPHQILAQYVTNCPNVNHFIAILDWADSGLNVNLLISNFHSVLSCLPSPPLNLNIPAPQTPQFRSSTYPHLCLCPSPQPPSPPSASCLLSGACSCLPLSSGCQHSPYPSSNTQLGVRQEDPVPVCEWFIFSGLFSPYHLATPPSSCLSVCF